MAYNKGCVIGEVTEIRPGEKYTIVVVHDGSNPQYPNDVACEFTSKNRTLIEKVQAGDWVVVEGSMRSKPWKDRIYTNFVCYSLALLERRRPPAVAPPPDLTKEDDIPF